MLNPPEVSMDFDPRDFDDARDRTEDLRDRDGDPRDVFTRELDLPQGREREIVRDRDREYTLRGSTPTSAGSSSGMPSCSERCRDGRSNCSSCDGLRG